MVAARFFFLRFHSPQFFEPAERRHLQTPDFAFVSVTGVDQSFFPCNCSLIRFSFPRSPYCFLIPPKAPFQLLLGSLFTFFLPLTYFGHQCPRRFRLLFPSIQAISPLLPFLPVSCRTIISFPTMDVDARASPCINQELNLPSCIRTPTLHRPPYEAWLCDNGSVLLSHYSISHSDWLVSPSALCFFSAYESV